MKENEIKDHHAQKEQSIANLPVPPEDFFVLPREDFLTWFANLEKTVAECQRVSSQLESKFSILNDFVRSVRNKK